MNRDFTIPSFFSDYKLEVGDSKAEFGPFDDSKYAVRLSGDFKLKKEGKDTFAGRLNIASPNFIQFGSDGFQLKGSVELNNILIWPVFLLKKASFEGDTKDLLKSLEVAGEVGLATTMLDFRPTKETKDPARSLAVTVGINDGKLNKIAFNGQGLKYQLCSTPYVLTGGNFIVNEIATNQPTKVGAGVSFESIIKLNKEPKVKASVDAEFSLQAMGINGKVELLPGFKNEILGINGFATANGSLKVDWSNKTLSGKSEFDILSKFLVGNVSFAADSNFNFGYIGQLKASVPAKIPLIGGQYLGEVGSAIQYINDNDKTNDWGATWAGINFLGIRKQFGAKVVFDGSYKSIGADDIATVKAEVGGTIKAISEGTLKKGISTTKQEKKYLPVSIDFSGGVDTDSQFIAISSSVRFDEVNDPKTWEWSNNKYLQIMTRDKRRDGTLHRNSYRIPPFSEFVEDVAEYIPALSSKSTAFYVIDLDKFKLKTGSDFAGIAGVQPARIPNNKDLFSLNSTLYKVTETPDITLTVQSLEWLLKPSSPSGKIAYHLSGIITSPIGEDVNKAFDGDINTKYLNKSKENSGILVTYNKLTRIKSFAITTANDFSERDPASYVLSGRNSNQEEWKEISAGSLSLPTERRTPGRRVFINNTEDFLQYLIYFPKLKDSTIANSLQLAELSLFETTPLDNQQPSLPSSMIALFNIPSPVDETVDKAFDGNVSTKWYVPPYNKVTPGIVVTYNTPTVIRSFTITTANDFSERDPASYELEGRNNDSDRWELINKGFLDLPTKRFTEGKRIVINNETGFSQ
ncbi:MAG: discoidin domain-containing protein [Cyanobium sp.]